MICTSDAIFFYPITAVILLEKYIQRVWIQFHKKLVRLLFTKLQQMSFSSFSPIIGVPTLVAKPVEHAQWSPYVNNGGSALAVAGREFCIVAADTRLSEGYSIASRTAPKIIKLTEKCVLATSGMQADAQTLHKNILARLEQYQHQNGKPMSTPAIAQMLSNMLYYKRFFPYYTFNVLGGIDENGIGCAYHYDAVGSMERSKYATAGTGQQLLHPVLDNQLHPQHQLAAKLEEKSLEELENLVIDAFNTASERDIYTGDFFEMYTVSQQGVKCNRYELKMD